MDIEAMHASGDGLARHSGSRLFVPFGIPGERLRVRIFRRRGNDAWASVESIVRASTHRVTPRCRHFGPPDRCGGCTWQHIDYREQLRLKTGIVGTLMTAAMGPHAPAVSPTLPTAPIDAPWGYRHKVHFAFVNARGRLAMGHYVRGSRRVFAAEECPVHDARGNAFAFALREECARAGVAAAPAGTLRGVVVRCAAATEEALATILVTGPGDKRLKAATVRALTRGGAPGSVHLNVHDAGDPYILGRDTRHIRGPRHLREGVAGATFLVSPTAFFQTNVFAAEILVRLVLDALPAGQPVLDLYAGAGLFAIPLARRGDVVVAVEENRAAASDGEAALRLNQLRPDRCRFVARKVEEALRSLGSGIARHAVLDPPREGCGAAVLDDLFGRLRPARAAYVSCNPEALAAELPRIVRHGYRIERLQPVDMFPHTAHVETVAVLAR